MPYTIQQINRIGYLFPEMPRAEPMQHIDTVVVEFLHLHGVEATPVSSDINPSRATNALMGAISPYALAENTHMTQRQKTAALQEWTSWKQWALSHADWADFYAAAKLRHEEAAAAQSEWLFARRKEIDERLAAHEDQLHRDDMFVIKVGCALLGAVLLVFLFEASRVQPEPPAPASQEVVQ